MAFVRFSGRRSRGLAYTDQVQRLHAKGNQISLEFPFGVVETSLDCGLEVEPADEEIMDLYWSQGGQDTGHFVTSEPIRVTKIDEDNWVLVASGHTTLKVWLDQVYFVLTVSEAR